MTRNSRRLFICLTLIVLTLVACNKVGDFLRSQKDGDIKYCNIKKISFNTGIPRNYTFTYNAQGYPVSAIVNVTGTAVPNHFFTYDKKQRLVQHAGHYDNGLYEFHTKFLHDAKGRIIRDTAWWWGEIINGEYGPAMGFNVTDYKYDKWDRMIESKLTWFDNSGSPSLITTYEYDADGNLIKPNTQYDNKINYNRTNKIWMFINRDYSVNNPFQAASYNQNKLPLNIGQDPEGPNRASFFRLGMDQAVFEYMCK